MASSKSDHRREVGQGPDGLLRPCDVGLDPSGRSLVLVTEEGAGVWMFAELTQRVQCCALTANE